MHYIIYAIYWGCQIQIVTGKNVKASQFCHKTPTSCGVCLKSSRPEFKASFTEFEKQRHRLDPSSMSWLSGIAFTVRGSLHSLRANTQLTATLRSLTSSPHHHQLLNLIAILSQIVGTYSVCQNSNHLQ